MEWDTALGKDPSFYRPVAGNRELQAEEMWPIPPVRYVMISLITKIAKTFDDQFLRPDGVLVIYFVGKNVEPLTIYLNSCAPYLH